VWIYKWIFVERRRAERERVPCKKERNISPPPIKQTRPRLAPPLVLIRKRLFFSTTNFAQKNKKKAKEMVDV
tara:strand:- start:212 stop:427 length:216 start_codon:yes stop_codon:yes gene_type:complete